MKYREETLQGESAWPGGEEFQRRLMASQPAEDTLGLLRFIASFLQQLYNTFTRPL